MARGVTDKRVNSTTEHEGKRLITVQDAPKVQALVVCVVEELPDHMTSLPAYAHLVSLAESLFSPIVGCQCS